jgi:hypothetical protein
MDASTAAHAWPRLLVPQFVADGHLNILMEFAERGDLSMVIRAAIANRRYVSFFHPNLSLNKPSFVRPSSCASAPNFDDLFWSLCAAARTRAAVCLLGASVCV